MANIKKIDLYTTGENGGFVKTFRSSSECAKYLGISHIAISNALTGRFVSKKLNGYRVEYSNEIKRAADSKPKGEPVFIEKVKGSDARKIAFINEILEKHQGKQLTKSTLAEYLFAEDIMDLARLKLRIQNKKVCDVGIEIIECFGKKD